MHVKNKGVPVRVYIVRHGETQDNLDGIIQGHRDTSLNSNGLEQARMAGEALKDAKLGIAFSSDLSRAVKTAEAILQHHPGITLHKRTELRERDMGELGGQHVGVGMGRAPRGLEPISEMAARAKSWWTEAVIPWIKAQGNAELEDGKWRAEGPRDVLIVSHGGFIGVLVQALQKGTVRVGEGVKLSKCLNASITVIEIDSVSTKGKISRYSDVSHLTGSMVEENADVQEP